MYPTIVLLQRCPQFFSKPEVEKMAEKGWGKRFDGQEDPMYFVVQNGGFTMIKAGIYVVSLQQVGSPYLGNPTEVALQLPREEQRAAWREHTGWISFDLLNEEITKKDAYAALAKFALHFGDEDCTAIYLPEQEVLMPNDGTAEEGLRMLLRKELPFSKPVWRRLIGG